MNVIILSQLFDTHGTVRLLEEMRNRGHSVHLVRPTECTIHLDAANSGVTYEGQRVDGADLALLRCAAHTRYGLTVVRAMEAAVATQLELSGTRCINTPAAKLRAHDKFLSLQLLHHAGVPVPRSFLAWEAINLEQVLRERLQPPFVLKSLEGSLGVGVMRADSLESALSIQDAMRSVERLVMAQHYVQEAQGQDIRVMVVGEEVVGAFRRTARPGEFRSNIHRGGTAEWVAIPQSYCDLALTATKALGLALAGVDLVETNPGPVVLEVNPSPGWKQIDLLSDLDVAAQIVTFLERLVDQ